MSRPISPTEVFYNDVHHKRLLNTIPSLTKILIEFFERVNSYHLAMCKMNVKMDSFHAMAESFDFPDGEKKEYIARAEWASMLKWCKKADNTYLSDAEMLLEEGFVFKKLVLGKEWLGYCLTQLLELREIHAGHSPQSRQSQQSLLSKQSRYSIPYMIKYPTYAEDEEYNPYD